jgi:hypothetical protein
MKNNLFALDEKNECVAAIPSGKTANHHCSEPVRESDASIVGAWVINRACFMESLKSLIARSNSRENRDMPFGFPDQLGKVTV